MSNPFSDLESFEALRSAALAGDEEYERYRRREAATARRHVSRATELQLSDRVQRMVEVAIASSRAVLLVGPPGTGKTEIIEQIVDKIDRDPARFGFIREGVDTHWVTPEEEWTFDRFVLGETVEDGDIKTVEGDLLRAIRHDQWLILDETNRADMDRVLGGVLTWMSGKKVQVGIRREAGKPNVPVYLEWIEQAESEVRAVDTPPSIEYAAGAEWRMLGTYNAVDAQRVFRMGHALSRRFKHVPVPPVSSKDFTVIIAGHIEDESLVDWLQERVSKLYEAHLALEDTQLGPGLFVDIPAYVESGFRMAQYDRKLSSESSTDKIMSNDDDDIAKGIKDSEAYSILSTSAEAGLNTNLLEELLAEAYLVSVGNVIAKYEPHLLTDLFYRISELEALNADSLAWIQQSLHSMRA